MWFKTKLPLAEILWRDASALQQGWLSHEESIKPESPNTYVRTIGFIIQDNEDSVIYCSDVGHDGETNGRSIIPKAMVKEIRYVTTRMVPPRRNRTSVTPLQGAGPTTER